MCVRVVCVTLYKCVELCVRVVHVSDFVGVQVYHVCDFVCVCFACEKVVCV
jgi:hypothetical protein